MTLKRVLIPLICFFLISMAVFAQNDDDDDDEKKSKPPSYGQSIQKMRNFKAHLDVALHNITTDSAINDFVDILWTAFAIILLIIAFSKYSFGGPLEEVVHCILLIVVARLILENYNYLTTALWDCSEGLAAGIQAAVVGDKDNALLIAFIHDVCDGLTMNDVSMLSGLRTYFAGFIMFVIVLLLSVLAFFVNTWALWGYALSKIIGYFFIPCLMFRRLNFLFDGWIRLFTGFLIYAVIARANIIMMVLALKSLFGIEGYTVNTGQVIRQWDITDLADIVGIASFTCVGILALISTGRFASAISSGAVGFGDSIQKVIGAAAKMTRAFF